MHANIKNWKKKGLLNYTHKRTYFCMITLHNQFKSPFPQTNADPKFVLCHGVNTGIYTLVMGLSDVFSFVYILNNQLCI